MGGAVVVGILGVISSWRGTLVSRQTEIERNYLEQIKSNSSRLDALVSERTALEASFRTQLAAADKALRDVEDYYRKMNKEFEEQIDRLQEQNRLLAMENYEMKRRMIGINEPAPPPYRQPIYIETEPPASEP